MKITHPAPQIQPRDNQGGPKSSAPAGTGDTTTTGGTTSSDPAVNVDLSPGAQGVIAAGKGNSPAHQAQDYLANLSVTADFKNFGQLVSQIAHGILPGSSEPAGDEPATDGADPVIDETGSTAPTDDGATTEEPAVIDEPVVVDEPVAEEPVIVVDEPVVEEPVVIDEPIVVFDEPVAEEPVAEEPTIVVDEPVAEEHVVIDEPIVVVDEPVAEEPVADEPVITVDEPVIDEPIITVDEPVVTDAELIDELTTDTTETV